MDLKSTTMIWQISLLFGFSHGASAEVTAEKIAAHCAMDSNGTVDQYMEYSVKLARTLSVYSPAALHRILGEYKATADDGTVLNDELGLNPVNFEGGSIEFAAGALEELDKVIEYLKDNPSVEIEIGGHTSLDKAGFESLSEDRANAAKLYLAKNGIDPSRVEAVGYAHSQPVADGYDNPENRRIEIIVKS